MKQFQPSFRAVLRTLVVLFVVLLPHLEAEDFHLTLQTTVASGWHPWYELKLDPQEPHNLLLCGTKWDSSKNAPFGFVYASSDQGKSWANVLEDRNSDWVTEQSCAFGTGHKVYFVSEASRIIDGTAHHELGVTRLYVSLDAGHTWKQPLQTGWADWSTSAVNMKSGQLFTFFNSYTAADAARGLGSSVGLLTFLPDASAVSGPFLLSSITKQNYQGAYPSDAVALRSGTVVALWYGTRLNSTGVVADLNVVRASEGQPPILESMNISHSKESTGCVTFNQASLAYDAKHDRLYVVYIGGCKEKELLLVSSDDEGRTWSKSLVIAETKGFFSGFSNPSLIVERDHQLVLWEAGNGSGKWFLSSIEHARLEPGMQLSDNKERRKLSNTSLLTSIEHSHSASPPSDSNLVVLNVRNEGNSVWRGNGLLASGERILAVWPTDEGNGSQLSFATFSGGPSVQEAVPASFPQSRDVTMDSTVLYGGTQDFNYRTSVLTVCLVLKNMGSRSLAAPIKLKAESMTSAAGSVAATNTNNGVTGPGATWDITSSLTGDRIPPRAISNPFCLTFRFDPETVARQASDPSELLNMAIRVFAADGDFNAQELPSDLNHFNQ